MKGASPFPVSNRQRTKSGSWLQSHFMDTTGALRTVIYRRLKGSKPLIAQLEDPLEVFSKYCAHVIASDYRFGSWSARLTPNGAEDEGKALFRPGRTGANFGPDTVDSVRGALEEAVARLTSQILPLIAT